MYRAHGHGDLRALLDIHRPLQNPQPTFSPVSLCLHPFYYMNSLPPTFHRRLCLCLSVALPLFPKVSQFFPDEDQDHRTHREGIRTEVSGNSWRRGLNNTSPYPSPLLKTSITIATLYSQGLLCISAPPLKGQQGPQWVFFQGLKAWNPGAWKGSVGSWLSLHV